MGYVDFGQDDWDDAEYSGDEEPLNKRAKGGDEGGERKRGVFNSLMHRLLAQSNPAGARQNMLPISGNRTHPG